jgi:hypothetical protein
MTRSDLLRSAPYPLQACRAVLDALFGRPIFDATGSWQDFSPGVLAQALQRGARVSLRGYFALQPRQSRGTRGRNPWTGQPAPRGPHTTAQAVFPRDFLRRKEKTSERINAGSKFAEERLGWRRK